MSFLYARPAHPALDVDHPLLPRLVGAWDFRSTARWDGSYLYPVDNTCQPLLLAAAGANWEQGSMGEAFSTDGSTDYRAQMIFGDEWDDLASEFTLGVIVERRVGQTFTGTVANLANESNSGTAFLDEATGGTSLRAGHPGASVVPQDPFGSTEGSVHAVITALQEDGTARHLVADPLSMTRAGLTARMSLREQVLTSSNRVSPPPRRLTAFLLWNTYNHYWDRFSQLVYALFVWRRALSPVEMENWAHDPWGLLRGVERWGGQAVGPLVVVPHRRISSGVGIGI